MASTKKRVAAPAAASVSPAETPKELEQKSESETGVPPAVVEKDVEDDDADPFKGLDEPVKDSDEYAQYKMIAGTYHRNEGGRRVVYGKGDKVRLTGAQARKLRGSVKRIGD